MFRIVFGCGVGTVDCGAVARGAFCFLIYGGIWWFCSLCLFGASAGWFGFDCCLCLLDIVIVGRICIGRLLARLLLWYYASALLVLVFYFVCVIWVWCCGLIC